MPAQPIYLDVEEEISELIERLRQTSALDVQVIVPSRSRIAESRFNFKLLKDYARQFGKRISIISPEPAVQHLAEENGFVAFADLEGYGAPKAEPALAMAGVAASYAPSYAPAPAPSPVAPPAAPVTRTPKMSMTPQRRLVSLDNRRGRMVLYAGAALLVLVALIAAAVLIPTASITLTAKAQSLSDTANVDAAPGAAPVKIRQVTTTKTLSQQFSATGVKDTPAAAASGSVTFTNTCAQSTWTLKQGQLVSTSSGVQFVLQTGSQVSDVPQAVSVLASIPGVAGNVGANTIKTISNNIGAKAGCLSVNNPNAMGGGTDEVKATFISQGDLDSAKAALTGTLRGTIIDELTKQAQSSEKLADTIDYAPTFTADHKANDAAALFNGTVSMVGNGAVYSVDDVKTALRNDLAKHVPAGFSLTDDPVQSDFHVSQSTADGHISFAGTAKGYIAPKLDFAKIQGRLIGSNTASARIYLQTLPVSKA
ncbi:MAG: baseplate J/gp47 family protein, partial [Candidatus Dormibacteraeota bacterium]|nr:baseplate J/gp47 family protein [Candidatus Dormibacteraeota bacterium]